MSAISTIDSLTKPAVYERRGGAAPTFQEGSIVAAKFLERAPKGDKILTDDKAALTLPPNSVIGDPGDRVYFEASKQNGNLALKQVFPEESKTFAKAYSKQVYSRALIDRSLPTDEEAKAAQEAEKTRIAVIRVKNALRSASAVQPEALAQMAAMGLNVDKLSADEITRITDNLPINPETAAPINPRRKTPEDWQELEPSAKEALTRLGFEPTRETLTAAQSLVAAEAPLTRQNMDRELYAKDDGISEATRRRQIAETRLRWSAESASAAFDLGIETDLAPLMSEVTKLKILEQADMARALLQQGAEATPENVSKLSDTFASLRLFPLITYSAFKAIHETAGPVTPKTVADAIADKYEKSATAPTAKYGDSFRKIAAEVSPLLEGMGIESTEGAVRAANILIRNNMDVTPANIADIRDIDAKVQDVYARLHPIIAAKLVKENRAPADMPLDDIIDYINAFEDKYGTNDGDRLARYIQRLDTSGGNMDWLENREQVMSLYRALYRISKNESASLGLTLELPEEQTLNNLAAQADIYTSGKSRYYQRKSRSDLIRDLEPENALRLANETNLRVSVEKAQTLIREFPKNTDENLQIRLETDYLQRRSDLPPLLEAAGEPITAKAAKLLAEANQPGALSKLLAKLAKADEESAAITDGLDDANLETLRNGEPIETRLSALQKAIAALPKSPEADEALELMRLLAITEQAGQAKRLPLRLNGRPTEATVTVLTDNLNPQDFTVLLALQTAMGNIQAAITAKNGKVETAIKAGSPKAEQALRQAAPKLAEYLAAEGLEAGEFKLDEELERELFVS